MGARAGAKQKPQQSAFRTGSQKGDVLSVLMSVKSRLLAETLATVPAFIRPGWTRSRMDELRSVCVAGLKVEDLLGIVAAVRYLMSRATVCSRPAKATEPAVVALVVLLGRLCLGWRRRRHLKRLNDWLAEAPKPVL